MFHALIIYIDTHMLSRIAHQTNNKKIMCAVSPELKLRRCLEGRGDQGGAELMTSCVMSHHEGQVSRTLVFELNTARGGLSNK